MQTPRDCNTRSNLLRWQNKRAHAMLLRRLPIHSDQRHLLMDIQITPIAHENPLFSWTAKPAEP
jgi:hypothetical protein